MHVSYRFVLLALCWSVTAATVAGQPPAGIPPESESSPAYQRRQIMESERWQKLERSFQEWLSVQSIYTPAEIAQLKTQLRNRITSMSPQQLEDFMMEMEDKLSVLLSDEATDARSFLNFLTPAARRQKLAQQGIQVTSLVNTTASQLRQELSQFKQSRVAARQAQSGFDRSREEQIARYDEQRREQQEAYTAAIRQPVTSVVPTVPAARGPFAPQSYGRTLIPQQSFYVSPWGRIGYRLPL